MEIENIRSGVADALAAGTALAEVRQIDVEAKGSIPFVTVPDGYRSENLEKLLAAPSRLRGVITLNDAASFIAVVNDHKGPQTRLFSSISPPSFTAVFNANVGEQPGWGDHRASYTAPLAPEWVTWNRMNGNKVDQVAFAEFIENNMPDIVEPDGATLLTIANTFEAKKKANFASAQKLGNGETQFTYEETIEGTAQKGAVRVPEQFVIAIPVFENGDSWRVEVRLRYRIADAGKLTLWYELVRPHKTIEAAVKELRESIARETSLHVLNGKAD